ncbi:hypothetical protein CRUP_032118, partial [Coryphaenoides rupestris]
VAAVDSRLASLCAGSAGPPAGRGAPSSTSSLMHCVMKLASGVAADNSPVQKLAFSLLANLAMSRDCRCILQKSNFLQSFLSVPIPRPGGGKAAAVGNNNDKTNSGAGGGGGGGGGGLLSMWLRLLASLSFGGEDGQQSILKVPGAKTNLKSQSVLLRLERARAVAKKDAVKGQDSTNAYLLICLENLCRLL